MELKVINLECKNCGAPVSTSQEKCSKCKQPVVITSFESVQKLSPLELNKYASGYQKDLAANPDSKVLNMSLAMCFLKLKLYDKAIPAFEKAMDDNFEYPEVFFYAAVSRLRGQKAFVAQRADIDKILEYLQAAILIEPKGIYHYFLSYVKHDYFHRKYLNISPNYLEEYNTAKGAGVSDNEIQVLFATLGVEKPAVI